MDQLNPPGLLDALVARVKRILPEFEDKVAGFPLMASPQKIMGRFKTKPFALVTCPTISFEARQPTDKRFHMKQVELARVFDIGLFYDPQLEGQAKSSAPLEDQLDRLINGLMNWTSCGWRFEPERIELVDHTDAVTVFSMTLCAYWLLKSEDLRPLPGDMPGGAPLEAIITKGTLG